MSRSKQNKATKGSAPLIEAAVRAALAASHHALLRGLIRRLGTPEAAEEVLSTFYVRSLSRASDLRSLRSWLHRVLETTIADYYRQRTAIRKVEVEGDATRMASIPHLEESDATLCRCFYRLLPTLRPDYAAVLRSIDLQGQSRAQVATRLGMTVNNLTVRLHRARSALRRRLQQTCLTCPIHGFFQCYCDYARRVRHAVLRNSQAGEV